jgi:hypothetical protein
MPAARHSIFVSYRREPDSWPTRSIVTQLRQRFGNAAVFIDVDDLDAGEDFQVGIDRALQGAVVLIAVIGKNWATADGAGRRRLGEEDDLVAHEIATALERPIPVVPVLVENAAMPPAADLPPDLKPLAKRHALALHHNGFAQGIVALGDRVEKLLATATAQQGAPGEAARAADAPAHEGLAAGVAQPSEVGRTAVAEEVAAQTVPPTVPVRGPQAQPGQGEPWWPPKFVPPGPVEPALPRWTPPIRSAPPAVDPPAEESPRAPGSLFCAAFGVPADSWAGGVGTALVTGALRILPRHTSTVVLRGVVSLAPALLLLGVVLAGVGGEAAAERVPGEPFVLALDPGLFDYAASLPLLGAVVGLLAFWIVSGGARGAAWVIGIGCLLSGLLLTVLLGIGPLAWMVHNQHFSRTDSYGWIGLLIAAALAVICWLGFASGLVLWDRRVAASRAVADRYFPVAVGALAVVVAGGAVLIDVGRLAVGFPGGDFWVDTGVVLTPGWRSVDYLAAWTVLGACSIALVVEAPDRASGRWAFSGGIAAVVLAVAGAIVGFALVG